MNKIDELLDATLARVSPFRTIARVVRVGAAGHRAVTPSGEVVPAFGELFASPVASQAMLDDAAFDQEAWLARAISDDFAPAESGAFVRGNGVNMPKGFLDAGLPTFPSGADGDFDDRPQDRLIDLVQSLREPYRQGAVWAMSSATLARIRKFKTNDGAFLWSSGLAAGQPDILLGYPVIESEDMPEIAPSSLSIAFGNFLAGYLIADGPTQIVWDAETHKPFVHFHATRRVGGTVADREAIKIMRFGAK